jgi:hypothetical protein
MNKPEKTCKKCGHTCHCLSADGCPDCINDICDVCDCGTTQSELDIPINFLNPNT